MLVSFQMTLLLEFQTKEWIPETPLLSEFNRTRTKRKPSNSKAMNKQSSSIVSLLGCLFLSVSILSGQSRQEDYRSRILRSKAKGITNLFNQLLPLHKVQMSSPIAIWVCKDRWMSRIPVLVTTLVSIPSSTIQTMYLPPVVV